MTLAAPAALLLLVLAPVLWLIHRRMRRRPPIVVPALLFLREELDAPPARRWRVDPELLLAIAALASLAMAAAGPALVLRAARHTVILVASGGAPADQRGWAERVQDAEARIAAVVGEDLDLHTVVVPTRADLPRPRASSLLAAAHAPAGRAGLVLSDLDAPDGEAAWWTAGRADASNAGIVAVTVSPEAVGLRVFALLAGSSPAPIEGVLVLDAPAAPIRRTPFRIPPDGLASVELGAAPAPDAFTLRIETAGGEPWQDDLAADDVVRFRRDPLRIAVAAGLPPDVIRVFDAAVLAALGPGGAVRTAAEADLALGTTDDLPPATVQVVLHPLPEGEPGLGAGPGRSRLRQDPIVEDLDARGVDLVFAPPALELGEDDEVLLGRGEQPLVPVVVRRGDRIHFLPDPTEGRPPPAEVALWPLFVQNALKQAGGAVGDAGYRRRGLLDRASSRLGRSAREAPALGLIPSRPPDRVALTHELGPWFASLALFLLAWLFAYPHVRRLRRPRRGG